MPMNIMEQQHRLGIVDGSVIIEGDGPGSDTSFIGGSIEDALATPPIPGALDAIHSLVTHFGGRVWLVSKCGARVEQKTRLTLPPKCATRLRSQEHTSELQSPDHLVCRLLPEK